MVAYAYVGLTRAASAACATRHETFKGLHTPAATGVCIPESEGNTQKVARRLQCIQSRPLDLKATPKRLQSPTQTLKPQSLKHSAHILYQC